jgi:hypothetical protein
VSHRRANCQVSDHVAHLSSFTAQVAYYLTQPELVCISLKNSAKEGSCCKLMSAEKRTQYGSGGSFFDKAKRKWVCPVVRQGTHFAEGRRTKVVCPVLGPEISRANQLRRKTKHCQECHTHLCVFKCPKLDRDSTRSIPEQGSSALPSVILTENIHCLY